MNQRKLIALMVILGILSCSKKDTELRQVIENEYNSNVDLSQEKPLFEVLASDKTGINFVNKLTEYPNFNFKNYAYIYNGAGVAVGDVNGDGLADVAFSGNLTSARLYINQGDFKFKDVTKEAGLLDSIGFRTGINMVDVNNDGHLDIYICKGGLYEDEYRKNILYINDGKGHFTNKAEQYGLADMSYSTQSYFFDMDKDGDLDLYLLNHPEDPRESNNLYTETNDKGEQRVILSKDLRFISDRLYRNEGNKFKDITESAGILNEAFGLSAVIGDFNEDMLPDVYVCNDYVKPDYLYINKGNGKFEEKFGDYFKHTSFSSMGSDYADINNDGCLDIMTLDMYPEDNYRQKMHGTEYNQDKYLLMTKLGFATQYIKNTLQISNCNGTFSDIGMMANIAHTDWSWATLFGDFDNDGLKDIFVTNGYRRSVSDNDYVRYTQDSLFKAVGQQNLTIEKIIATIPEHKTTSFLYKNNGDLSFSNVSSKWNAGHPKFSNGAAYADLNNDGYLDLLTNNLDEVPTIYKNIGQSSRNNNFLRIQLKASEKQTCLGTKVDITSTSGKFQSQTYYQARGFLSSVEPVLHFGLGKDSDIQEVKITWPNGKVQVINKLAINKVHTISQDDSQSILAKIYTNPNLYFETEKPLDIKHVENDFIDFKREPLLHRKYSVEGPAVAIADLNSDGLDEMYIGGAAGFEGMIYTQNSNATFSPVPNADISSDKASEDTAAEFVDVNKDGKLDLVVISGGSEFPENAPQYQDRLYINQGDGKFKKQTGGMPIVLSSGACITKADIDNDGDEDIFVGGRVVPGKFPTAPMSYIAKNEGGKFVNITPNISDGLFKIGMVTSAQFADLDNDKSKELIVACEWGPINVFKMENGKFVNRTVEFGLDKKTGWWENIHIADMNGDGYNDIIAGNAGLNTHMKASNEQPITVHYNDYDKNSSIDALICFHNGDKSYPLAMRDELLDQMIMLKKKYLRYKNYANATINSIFTSEQRKGEQTYSVNTLASKVFYNEGGKRFNDVTMPVLSQLSCNRSFVTIDINQDKKLDIIAAGNNYGTDVFVGRYDASYGSLMLNQGAHQLKAVSNATSGLNIGGDVRHIKAIKTKEGTQLLVIRNSDSASIVSIKEPKVNQ